MASQVNNVTDAGRAICGDYSQDYNGILLNVSARPRNGLVFQGGLNTGTTEPTTATSGRRARAHRAAAPQSPTNPWCNTSTGWVTRYTGLGSYTVPKVDVLVSGTFRSDQGAPLAANMVVHARRRRRSAAPFANNAPNVTVNLVEPGTLYGDRVNEIDLRFAKILRFGRTRTNVGFDIYNITELGAGADLQPGVQPDDQHAIVGELAGAAVVLQPRFVKFSVQIDF